MPLSPYFRLMRLHQPVGIWLLLWPCWWSIALATYGYPSLKILLLFALGSVLMRSAGCIINDMADREFDKKVERTRTRPLASGELSIKQAFGLLALLLLGALLIAFCLSEAVVLWAILSLIPVAIYPFMKRISWWPQLFLGLTFNWGALMGWAAVRGELEWPAIALYVGGVFWTLGYDTIYAHQDKVDDVNADIKSTALRFGDHTQNIVALFYMLAIECWALAGSLAGMHNAFYILMLPVAIHAIWQVKAVQLNSVASCRQIFVSNTSLGALLMAAIMLGRTTI